jgi:hypothetical protein
MACFINGWGNETKQLHLIVQAKYRENFYMVFLDLYLISNLTYNSCFIQHGAIPGVYERPRFVISRRVLLSASVTRLIPEKLRLDIKEQVGASHSSSTMVLYLEEAIATLKVEITVRNEGAIIIQKRGYHNH